MWKFLILAVLGVVVSVSALAAASLMPGPSAAQPGTLYAVDGAGTQMGDCDGTLSNLYTMNPSTGAAALVGPIMINSSQAKHVTAIAVHPSSGVLYGVMTSQQADCSDSNLSTLLSINTSTAAATVIGSNGSLEHQIPDIDFDPSGQLYGWSEGTPSGPLAIPSGIGPGPGSDDLITIDITNGTAAVVGDCGCSTSRTGLSIMSTGAMYMKSGGSDIIVASESNSFLYRINPASGTIITTLALDNNTHNLLAFDPGDVLFTGTRDRNAGTFTLQTINHTTGVVSDVGTTSVSHLISAIAFDRTPPPGQQVTWADNNCKDGVNPIDSLFVLRGDAGLPTDTGECPDMGANIEVLNASPHIWGDVDCGGAMTPVDSLKILRHDAGLSASQEQPCPAMGAVVQLTDPPVSKGGVLGRLIRQRSLGAGSAGTPARLPSTGGYPAGQDDGALPWEVSLLDLPLALAAAGVAGVSWHRYRRRAN